MKLKLTTLLFWVFGFAIAQKQIQPYTFTNKVNDSTKTILIYASAKSANDIIFYLKNDKNEPFKNIKNGENLSFEVFPFTEIIFRNKLKQALSLIKDDNVAQKMLDTNHIETSRNIYQFFNALIITAFQYDNEPVAGTLKYSLNANISKISGNTDFYNLSKEIKKSKGNKLKSDKFKVPEFIDSINLEIKALYKYERNKIEKIIKKKYNGFRIAKLLEKNFLSEYINKKKSIDELDLKIEFSKSLNKEAREKIDSIKLDTQHKLNILSPQMFDLNFNTNILIDQLKNEDEDIKNKKNNLKQLIDKNQFNINLVDLLKASSINYTEIASQTTTNFSELIKEVKQAEKSYKTKNEEKNNNLKKIDSLKNKYSNLLDKSANAETKYNELLKERTKSLKQQKKLLIKDIDEYIINKRKQILGIPLFEFKINEIQLDVNNGFIEHITVSGNIKQAFIPEDLIWQSYVKPKKRGVIKKNKQSSLSYQQIKKYVVKFYNEPLVKKILGIVDKELKFVNEFPLGFSSRTDFDDLRIYDLHSYEGKRPTFSVPLREIIKMYVQKHQNDRLDFSPKNQTITLPRDDRNKEFSLELKKEQSSKILGARFFSDFVGFNQADPNGLIQIEIEKNIPLWTRRYLIRGSRGRNIGWANYVKPSFNWARIEEREEKLSLTNNTISYLDLVRFKDISIGLDLNVFTFDVPNSKLRFELNGGAHYARTKVINLIKSVTENVGFFNVYPEVLVKIRPEERFGGALKYKPNKILIPRGENFKPFDNIINEGQWLHSIEFSTFFTPSVKSDNKFFFRYRYTNTANQESNGFSQFQVGYLAYLKF